MAEYYNLGQGARARRALYYEILKFQPENLELLHQNFDVVSLPDPTCDTPEILQEMEVVFAPLGYYLDGQKIDRMPGLKVIGSNTTGVPHIDTEYAASKGVEVISLAGRTDFLSSITPTGEHTWGLLLGLMRRIPWAFDYVKDGGWNRRPFGAEAMLSSLTMGIVGLGRLGCMVAQQGLAFRMTVRYIDPSEPVSPIPGVQRCESLGELVAASDVVSLHVPLTPENVGLISRDVLARFKRGAYLVNTSRGELVDSEALLDSLISGHLAGAALDVFEGEFAPDFLYHFKDHPLLEYARTHDNLLITPHIGGSTIDAWRKTEEYTIRLITDHLAKEGAGAFR